jgi:hypothetical protein
LWLTNLTHTVNEFRNVGMIGIVNEPEQNVNITQSMIDDYYPEAYTVTQPIPFFRKSELIVLRLYVELSRH